MVVISCWEAVVGGGRWVDWVAVRLPRRGLTLRLRRFWNCDYGARALVVVLIPCPRWHLPRLTQFDT
jgi:hypothetical protein